MTTAAAAASVRAATASTQYGSPPTAAKVRAPRNITIDVLRGACIVMMVGSHIGTNTYLNTLVHPFRFVSGAEGFVFLSGLVLGLVSRRRMQEGPVGQAYLTVWRRARIIWLVHCATVLLALGVSSWISRIPSIPDVSAVPLYSVLWLTATLQLQPGMMLNILPLYVMVLAAAPLALEAMRRGRTILLLLVSFALFLFTQYQPHAGRLAHEISGGEAFPVLSWQFLFFVGLCVGYHQATLRNLLLVRYRAALRWALTAACVVVAVVVWVQTPNFAFYDHVRWDAYLWERHPLRFGRVLYFFLAISAAYLLVQHLLQSSVLASRVGGMLALLGRNSLYVFLVHLVPAAVVSMAALSSRHWMLVEAVTLGSWALVYLLAKHQVGRRFIPN